MRPAKKPRRWRIDVSNARETIHGAVEIAGSPTGEALGVNCRARRLLRALTSAFRKRIVYLDRSGATLNADRIQLSPGEGCTREFDRPRARVRVRTCAGVGKNSEFSAWVANVLVRIFGLY